MKNFIGTSNTGMGKVFEDLIQTLEFKNVVIIEEGLSYSQFLQSQGAELIQISPKNSEIISPEKDGKNEL